MLTAEEKFKLHTIRTSVENKEVPTAKTIYWLLDLAIKLENQCRNLEKLGELHAKEKQELMQKMTELKNKIIDFVSRELL